MKGTLICDNPSRVLITSLVCAIRFPLPINLLQLDLQIITISVIHVISSMEYMELALIIFSNFFLTNNSNRGLICCCLCLIGFDLEIKGIEWLATSISILFHKSSYDQSNMSRNYFINLFRPFTCPSYNVFVHLDVFWILSIVRHIHQLPITFRHMRCLIWNMIPIFYHPLEIFGHHIRSYRKLYQSRRRATLIHIKKNKKFHVWHRGSNTVSILHLS